MSTRGRKHFTLFADKCVNDFCEKPATRFGFCAEHYEQEIDFQWDKLQAEGRVQPRWECFDTDRQWQEYEVHSLTGKAVRTVATNPCRDCTPEYQREMLAAGRCRHPETVFVRRKGSDIEGFNAEKFRSWTEAVRGERGPVVMMPSVAARMQATTGGAQ